MRVLLVGRGPPERGGIPAFLSLLCSSELTRWHELEMLNLTPADGAREGGKASLRNVQRTVGDMLRVRRAAVGTDIVHLHSALAPLVTLLRAGALAVAGRLGGARVVVHAHGGLLQAWMRRRGGRALVRLALAPATMVLAVSEGGHAALADVIGCRRVRLLSNGVDTQRFRPGSDDHDPPRILYVGTLTPRKGVVDLIAASERLRARGVPHELLIAGGTPDEGAAAEAVVRRAADGHVRFLGSCAHDEMAEVYRMAEVLCLPSWWEAAPLAVLEAMASGLPVIATTVGDIPRMVIDGVTGRLVPPRDPEALAAALVPLLTDGRLRHRYGSAARRHVEEEFSAQATVAAIHAVYRGASAPADRKRHSA